MVILIILLLVTSTFVVGVILACMATNFKTYKSYKETYEILKSGKLVIAFETPEIVVLNEEMKTYSARSHLIGQSFFIKMEL